MGLSIEPETKKRPLRLLGLILLLILAGILWRQKDQLPLSFNNGSPLQPESEIQAEIPAATEAPSQVELVYSAVINPDSDAFTAPLYLNDTEHLETGIWEGIGGRSAVITYTVQQNDTLWGIAIQFGLDLDTIRWSNPALERNPDLLNTGAELVILPVIGAYHTVTEDETLDSIAQTYGVADVDIINYPLNALSPPYNLSIGDNLIIPNGRKEIILPQPNPDSDYPLAWPIVGRLTQSYSAKHQAIDIGSVYGAEVYAADAGTVVYAEWAQTGYGYTVIIAHDNDRTTLYSHLKGALLQKGQQVARNDPIGAVGSTGNSTGPHVHFEVRENQKRMNPLNYLSIQ